MGSQKGPVEWVLRKVVPGPVEWALRKGPLELILKKGPVEWALKEGPFEWVFRKMLSGPVEWAPKRGPDESSRLTRFFAATISGLSLISCFTTSNSPLNNGSFSMSIL